MAAPSAWTAWSLALLTLASGCTTPPQADPASPPPGLAVPPAAPLPETAPPAQASDDSCGLEGFVGTDELLPIAGAQVRLNSNEPHYTAQDGRFSFDHLPPRAYRLFVSAAGFEPQNRTVECQAGDVDRDVLFGLVARPPPGELFSETFHVRGHLGCAAATGGRGGDDACGYGQGASWGDYFPTIDPQAKHRFSMRLPVGEVTGILYEAKWQRSGPLGAERLWIRGPPFEGLYGGPLHPEDPVAMDFCPTTQIVRDSGEWAWFVAGSSVLCARFVATDERFPLDIVTPTRSSNHDSQVRQVDVGVYATEAGVALQQDFELVVSFFYHSLPIPDGFSMLEP